MMRMHSLTSESHWRLGLIDDAIIQFSEALRIRPDFTVARRARSSDEPPPTLPNATATVARFATVLPLQAIQIFKLLQQRKGREHRSRPEERAGLRIRN